MTNKSNKVICLSGSKLKTVGGQKIAPSALWKLIKSANDPMLGNASEGIKSGLKTIAILSVLTAHISIYSCDLEACKSLERILIFWGSTGVGIFFAIIGKEWPSKRKTLKETTKAYIKYYIIPAFFRDLLSMRR